MSKKVRFLVLSCLTGSLFVLGACGSSALPPPVQLSIRDSMFKDKGKVVQITNASNHHLYNVMVSGRSLSEPSGASVRATEELKPNETVEVGWIQFRTWTPQSGESIEVYCDNYAIPKVIVIP